MTDEIQSVKEKVTAVILPGYLKGSSGEVNFRARFANKTTKVEILLHDKMPHILSSGNKNEVSAVNVNHTQFFGYLNICLYR